MDIRVGDICRLKKEHPCKSKEWLVLRSGADFRIRCQGCLHEVMLEREKLEKNVRRIIRNGEEINPRSEKPKLIQKTQGKEGDE